MGKEEPESFHGGYQGSYRAGRAGQIVECAPCRTVGGRILQADNMAATEHTIHIHPLAPPKAALGAACNGCGVCCLFAPCPLGMVLSRRRSGACAALRWDDTLVQYRCGALVAPRDVVVQALPRGMRAVAPALAPLLRQLAARWIAAGSGCDSSLEVTMPPSDANTKEATVTTVHQPPT